MLKLHSRVLLPYKFTLLSNLLQAGRANAAVLLPYKFTLLSNSSLIYDTYPAVLLPYKFTLLSNLKFGKATLLAVYLQGRNYHYNITFSIMSQLYNAQIIINNYSFFESRFSLVGRFDTQEWYSVLNNRFKHINTVLPAYSVIARKNSKSFSSKVS